MPNERLKHLEERLAWLERHITEQDKAMLEQARLLDRLLAELRHLRDRLASASPAEIPSSSPAQDRPPHY